MTETPPEAPKAPAAPPAEAEPPEEARGRADEPDRGLGGTGGTGGPQAEGRGPHEPPDEEELSIGHYFGGYAIIFLGAVGLALLLVLVMKLAR